MRPTPETTTQSEHNSDGQPNKRHGDGGPEPEQKDGQEGKVVGTQPGTLSLLAKPDAELVQPENDACIHGYSGGVGCDPCSGAHPYRTGAS